VKSSPDDKNFLIKKEVRIEKEARTGGPLKERKGSCRQSQARKRKKREKPFGAKKDTSSSEKKEKPHPNRRSPGMGREVRLD